MKEQRRQKLMTTRIEAGGPQTPLSSDPLAQRTTALPHRPFQSVLNASATAVVGGAEAAVSQLPGGPILAASFRSAPAGGPPAQTPTGSGAASPGAASAPGTAPAGDGGVEQMLSQTADQNLYFLQLQEQMAAENRQYSALSNVMKARHETVKNAIGNIR
jgi:hypothetical protein